MTGTGAVVLFHAVVSLLAILSGFAVIAGLIRGAQRPQGTRTFLASAIVTSATGFMIPFEKILGTHIAAIVGLVVLAVMLVALYGFGNRGAWRVVYVVGVLASVYLLVFAGLAQAFLKIAPLHAIAPQLNELPFITAELAALAVFAALGVLIFRARASAAQ